MIFVGVDWAEAHHDVHVEDEQGRRLGSGRLPEGVEGIARFHELVGAHADEPAEVVIGIETDRGLFVAALVAAGYQVFAVNPMSASRYRDRHRLSGAKSDPGDAKVLADLVRTDRHNHRPVAGDTDLAEAVKVAGPGAPVDDLGPAPPGEPAPLRAAGVLPRRAGRVRRPGQQRRHRRAARRHRRRQLGAALSRTQDRRRACAAAAGSAASTSAPPRSRPRCAPPQLQPPPWLSPRWAQPWPRSAAVIADDDHARSPCWQQQLAADFEQHPDAKVVRSLPGLGTILGARVLGEFGDDRTATPPPSLARTTPARHPSPGPRAPTGSCWPATPATSGSPTRSTSGPSPRSPPAPAPAPSTTTAAPPATPTTRPCAPSATASSASSTAAWPATPSTTKTPPGATAPATKLPSCLTFRAVGCLAASDADMVRAAQDAMAPLRVRLPWLVPQIRTAVTDSRDVTPIPVRPVGPLAPPARPCACGCGELVISGATAGRPRRYVSHAHRVTGCARS